MADLDALLQGPEPTFEDDADIDLSRLAAVDREAILARVTPDDSTPPDAFSLSQNELRRELIDRGLQPKGFFNDDAARLQEEFKREHAAETEARMQHKVQLAARSYWQETVQRRRVERETQLREEAHEVAMDPTLEVWLRLVQENTTPPHASLPLSTIGTRAVSKPLARNHSLLSLSLSRCQLDDQGAHYLALALQHNTALQRLELAENALGPTAAHELADALTSNASLVVLNLESNSLTDDEKDPSGIAALAKMLTTNRTLRSLMLWRTRLGSEGGKLLSNAIVQNDTLLCLDIGNNRVLPADAARIAEHLAKNRVSYDATQDAQVGLRKAQLAAAEKEKQRHLAEKKQAEHEAWIEARKEERAKEREVQEAERQRKKQEEDDRLRQIAARKAAEFAAKLEMEKTKKKKKGGKKKK